MGNPYKRVAADAFQSMLLDAGVLLSSFNFANPYATPTDDKIIATTTGGLNPSCVPQYSDLGEDVDNVPNNTKEFLHLDGWECNLSYTSIKFNPANTMWTLGAADEEDAPTGAPTGTTKIVPRTSVAQTDFKDIYAAVPMADGGIFVAVLKNAISTGGLNIQTTKNGKGTNQVTITGYMAVNDQDTVPMEFYHIPAPVKQLTVSSAAGTTAGKTTITVSPEKGSSESYKYKIGARAEVVSYDTDMTLSDWTAWDGTAEITAETGKIITVVTVKDNKASRAGSATVTAKEATT